MCLRESRYIFSERNAMMLDISQFLCKSSLKFDSNFIQYELYERQQNRAGKYSLVFSLTFSKSSSRFHNGALYTMCTEPMQCAALSTKALHQSLGQRYPQRCLQVVYSLPSRSICSSAVVQAGVSCPLLFDPLQNSKSPYSCTS